MASELTQVEVQFLAIAAKLFAAAMIFLAHLPDDGQQIYLDRKVKDEIVHTSLENQFNAFMGDPMKVRKKPRIHPIIQIMAQEWKAAEAEQCMPNWGIFTFDYVSEHCNAQQEAHTDWHLHLSTLDFTVYLQGIPDDRHWWLTGFPPPQGDPEGRPHTKEHCADILIAYPSYLMPPKAASELTQVESLFLAIAARLFTAAITFSAHPPDDGQQAYLVRKVKDEIILVGNQFKKFMGDPSKHTKKPRMHPIIQIMSEEWKAAEAEQRMPEWGIFTLDHISGYRHAQREAHSDWHPDLSTLDLSNYLQGLQNHRRWWVTGLPPPQGDLDVAMEGLAAPAQPSVPVPPVSLTMPDVPAVTKGKGHALPPAGSSDPHGTLPAPIAQPAPPYDFRNTRRHPVAQPSQGTSTTTQSDEFEDCTLSDMIADMDSTPSAQGRASDSSLPCVQVDDASPPPPAQRRHLDVKPLIATGDYRCCPCKSRKINNTEYLDLPPGVEASYGPLAVGTSSIYPGEELESRVDSLEAKMDHAILVLNALAGTQGIIPSTLPGYIQPPPPRRSPSPSHHSLSSPGVAITSLGLSDSLSEPQSCSSSRLEHSALCTSKEEVLEAQVAHLLSRNEIYIIWCLTRRIGPMCKSETFQ
ncbi:hypothetical protein EI94DRAFT_1703708 [Lactarius quietus]|nr:hypothetical protein EI94DRAFT_1703708 [Lactarius quietus]